MEYIRDEYNEHMIINYFIFLKYKQSFAYIRISSSQPAECCDITSRLKLVVSSPIWILCVRWHIIDYLHLYLYYTSDKPSIYSIWCQIYGYENSSPLFSLLFLSFIQNGIGYHFASSLLFFLPVLKC